MVDSPACLVSEDSPLAVSEGGGRDTCEKVT